MPNNFEVYIGIAVEDRQLKSRELKVFLRELTPYVSGPISDTTRNETYKVTDDKGGILTGNVNTTNNVSADYFGLNTNSSFPPDIVKGEQVLILKYADEDKYYWVPTGRDDNLRRGELIRWSASNDMASGDKTLGETNTYFVEIDTKLAKRIRLHTSKSDGESYGYDLVLDATNKCIQLKDDAGNMIELLSESGEVNITSSNKSKISLGGGGATVLAPDTIVIRAGREIVFKAPKITSHEG